MNCCVEFRCFSSANAKRHSRQYRHNGQNRQSGRARRCGRIRGRASLGASTPVARTPVISTRTPVARTPVARTPVAGTCRWHLSLAPVARTCRAYRFSHWRTSEADSFPVQPLSSAPTPIIGTCRAYQPLSRARKNPPHHEGCDGPHNGDSVCFHFAGVTIRFVFRIGNPFAFCGSSTCSQIATRCPALISLCKYPSRE